MKKESKNNNDTLLGKAQTNTAISNTTRELVSATVDLSGMHCPNLLPKINEAIKQISIHQAIKIIVTDPGTKRDVPIWCKMTGNKLLSQEFNSDTYQYYYLIERLV